MKALAILEIFKFKRVYKRLKKLNRILNMKSIKVILALVTILLCLYTLIIYNIRHIAFARRHLKTKHIRRPISSTEEYDDTPMRHISYKDIYKNIYTHDEDFSIEMEESKQATMINTAGCVIPVAMVDYKNDTRELFRERCGPRIIYMKRYGNDRVQAIISEIEMKKLLKINEKYVCCYRFLQESKFSLNEHLKIQYTSCTIFGDGEKIKLQSDFINVQCFQYDISNKSYLIYEDNYVFCKRVNISSSNSDYNQVKYNVIVIGMDSMSLPRFAQTMTRTINFFKNNNWLSYRGYHKVGDNTLPNLLPVLTGKNFSEIVENCYKKMDNCNDYFLWSLFKKSGYATAYGEDFLKLPDTFSREFSFQKSPTDHYMRPFFLHREYEINDHSLLCAGKLTSCQQVLDFAYDFALTYRNDSFFGFFWINSFSHNINNDTRKADLLFENFFNRIIYTGVLDNTFIVFMSDHGIRFGKQRLQIESYYDNRMPFLFFWVPNTFKNKYPDKLKGLMINQFRLITPYDLFDTLNELNNLTELNNNTIMEQDNPVTHGTVTERQSMFEIISANRTCKDVRIHEKWCSCHKLYPLDVNDVDGVRSVHYVASYIRTTLKRIKTKRCWSCLDLSIQNISRLHFYYDRDKVNLYYVVAFSMTPKNLFYEAVVLRNDTRMDLVGTVNLISQYEGFGSCTISRLDQIFCICQKIYNCYNS